jgi:two-component system response regulator RegA
MGGGTNYKVIMSCLIDSMDVLPQSSAAVRAKDDTLLLVEDDAPTARAMIRLMEAAGVRVEWVGTLKDGLAALSRIPSLVVLDLKLPDGSGVELLEAIRSSHMRSKVAIVSANADAGVFARLLAAKPDAIFPKPLDFEDFVQWLCESYPGSASQEAAA